MYKYVLLKDAEVIVVSHYGNQEGAEADHALLAILERMSITEKNRFRAVVHDYSRVSAMTLNDTDMSRVESFRKKLARHFGCNEISAFRSKIARYIVRPIRPDILAIHLERVTRVHKHHDPDFNYIISGSLSSALQAREINELPNDEEWLRPNPANKDSEL